MKRESICTAIAIAVLVGGVALGVWYDTRYAYLMPLPSPKSDYQAAHSEHAEHHQRDINSGVSVGRTESADDKRTGDDGNYTHNNSITNWIQAISAVASTTAAFAILFVYIKQSDIMRRQLKAAFRTANAAKRSADTASRALADLERPWLFSEGVRVIARQKPPYENNWFIQFHFKNVGRMPALVEACDIKFGERAILPPVPDYSNAVPVGINRTIPVGESAETQTIGPAVVGHNREMVAYGRLIYLELNGTRHHTGFSFAVSPVFPASVAYPSDTYNYYD